MWLKYIQIIQIFRLSIYPIIFLSKVAWTGKAGEGGGGWFDRRKSSGWKESVLSTVKLKKDIWPA